MIDSEELCKCLDTSSRRKFVRLSIVEFNILIADFELLGGTIDRRSETFTIGYLDNNKIFLYCHLTNKILSKYSTEEIIRLLQLKERNNDE